MMLRLSPLERTYQSSKFDISYSDSRQSYPWLSSSIGAGWLTGSASGNGTVTASNAELWDGLGECINPLFMAPLILILLLVNAWPDRPDDTRLGLAHDPQLGLYNFNI